MSDPVNPDHYKFDNVEAINILRMVLTPEEYVGGLKFSLWQYLLRYERKGGILDLEKANWYLDKMIEEFRERTQT